MGPASAWAKFQVTNTSNTRTAETCLTGTCLLANSELVAREYTKPYSFHCSYIALVFRGAHCFENMFSTVLSSQSVHYSTTVSI